MGSWLEPLAQFLAAEKARLGQGLRRSLLATALALFAALALLEGLAMVLVGLYVSLSRTMNPWAAGLLVGGTLILLSLVLLVVALRLPAARKRLPEASPLTARRPAEPARPVDAPTLLKAAATELIDRSEIKARNIALGALLAGLVLGASPGLRRQLFGRKRNP
jgi:ABC-type nickel/cobalt efflux system permease component RcnA